MENIEKQSNAEKYYHSLLTFGMIPGLDRIAILLEKLGNPQDSLRCVHVAGTNGKGTTCTFIASVLKTAGYKTGLYTSPYIVDFRERIRINGSMISEGELDAVTLKVKAEIDRLSKNNIVITEFEAVTAAAFLYFKEQNCDFVVLETGLGGRFDATNVIKNPLVSVITSISLDHVKILGDTLSQIAFEKCGIIKENCPSVTCSSQDIEVMEMIDSQCKKKNSELTVADESCCSIISASIKGSDISYKGKKIFLPFPGKHQTENCISALECIEHLKKQGVEISDDSIMSGIASSENPARCEIVSEKPLIILDGCHNEGSALALKSIIESFLPGKKIKALMGMMSDKAIDKVLDILLPYFDSVVTVTPSNPRAIRAYDLAKKIKSRNTDAIFADSPKEGLSLVMDKLCENETLIVCGSLYLCADIRKFLKP